MRYRDSATLSHYLAFYLLSADDLGRGVVGTTARCLEEVTIGHDIGQTKVTDLDIVVLVEQQATVGEEDNQLKRSLDWQLKLPWPALTHFSGLRSRWTILCRWQYSMAQMICWNRLRASASGILPLSTMYWNSSRGAYCGGVDVEEKVNSVR